MTSSTTSGTPQSTHPAYRRGSVASRERERMPPADVATSAEVDRARRRSVPGRRRRPSLAAVGRSSRSIDTHVDELGRIDAIAGDGDHGIGMQRGSHAAPRAAIAARDAGAGARTVLARAADAWADSAGGTSGALWGADPRAAWPGSSATTVALPRRTSPRASPPACSRVMTYGKAEVGDKTLVDAIVPVQRGTHPARSTPVRASPRRGRSRRMPPPGLRRSDRRSAPPHGPGSSARREVSRHPRPGRALARAHRDGRRRRPRKELT